MTAQVLTRLHRSVQALDGVLLTLALLVLGLVLVVPSQAIASVRFTLENLRDVAPFLLLSVAIAAYAQASGAENLIARAFRGKVSSMIGLAALVGALSPFCSCGVIPLIAALLSMGVPLAPVMAFWLSSPLMDPSMFVLTTGTLGFNFAIAKTIAAIAIGLLGGGGIWLLSQTQYFNQSFEQSLREGVGDGGCGGSRIRKPKAIHWKFWQHPERQTAFRRGALKNTLFLGKWLALAFLLESLMLAYLPADWIIQWVGQRGIGSVLGAALVGLPAYLNGYAALPLVSGLLQQGMTPAAGMTFLLAGGATSIPAAIAVFALVRWPVFVAYLGFALVGSVLAGLAYGVWVA